MGFSSNEWFWRGWYCFFWQGTGGFCLNEGEGGDEVMWLIFGSCTAKDVLVGLPPEYELVIYNVNDTSKSNIDSI